MVTVDAVNTPELPPTALESPDLSSEHASLGNSDNSASSVHSDSSTLVYGHESFDQFVTLVEELCRSLWANPKKSLIERFSSSQLGELLHARKILGSSLSATSNDFIVERLAGGGFNRIIGITITNKKSKTSRQLILRIPRFEDAKPEREVATLRYIRQHTSIPVADTEAVDFTANNPLKKSYVIQKRIAGSDLQAIIQEMSHEQHCAMAKELARILLVLQSVKHPTAGIIEGVADGDGAHHGFVVRPFELKTPFGIEPEPEGVYQAIDCTEKPTTLDFFRAQLGRWKAVDTPYGAHKVDLWDQLIGAALQMHRSGFFDDNENCLCHLDYEARNVMVDISPNKGSVAITGILDWDSAIFAPRFVSCAPPWWIWADDDDEDNDEDESKANDLPRSATGQELKRQFEDVVGKEYLHYAYAPQYRLARMLFQLAVHGIRSNEYFNLAEKFLAEWETLYESITPQEKRTVDKELIMT